MSYEFGKAISIILLLLVIIATIGFCIIRVLALNSDPHTWFNTTVRPSLATSPRLRSAFGLHFDGDARSDYLSPKRKKLIIEIDREKGRELLPQSVEKLAAVASSVTDKEVQVVFSSEFSNSQEGYDDQTVLELKRRNQSYHTNDNTATFYLILLGRGNGEDSQIGRTLEEDGAVLYLDEADKYPEYLRLSAETSTLLHEFGHQMGLQHNSDSGCLMNSQIDEGGWNYPGNLATQYCAIEQQQLKTLKASYH